MKRAYFICLFLCLTNTFAARPVQAQTETVLYNFCSQPSCSDGSGPMSQLTSDGKGNFYGTTERGGQGCAGSGCGTVFELSPNGSGGWNETVIHSFTDAPDGAGPLLSLVIFDSVGNLYGTTESGGANGAGTVFELSPVGTSWTENVLYNFCSAANCADGGGPAAGLIFDPAGNLYGTFLASGDSASSATVFELSPSDGGWTEQVIYEAGASEFGLTMDDSGNVYGTTGAIGYFDYGTVFELSPNGSGGWNPTVIHTFAGYPKDGWNPVGNPVLDQAGNLYGTTNGGGPKGHGTVYKLSPNEGGWTEEILPAFRECIVDGCTPVAGVVLDADGNIYGTTQGGSDGYAMGTVYELVAPVGKGKYKEVPLWSFTGTDGSYPMASLILDRAGNLYGTTYQGGSSNAGVVFEVTGVRATTTTALSSSPNPSQSGQAVTFTAVVASTFGTQPDGETVSFMKGKTVLGTGTLSGGSATFTTSTLKVGTTSVTAVYGGDSNFAGSTSKAVKQLVKKAGE